MQTRNKPDRSDKHLKKVVNLCYEMLELADHGDKFRLDDGCGVVFGTLRDAAYKVRKLAEREIRVHDQVRGTSSGRKSENETKQNNP